MMTWWQLMRTSLRTDLTLTGTGTKTVRCCMHGYAPSCLLSVTRIQRCDQERHGGSPTNKGVLSRVGLLQTLWRAETGE